MPGTLVLCATPIGNLSDAGPRLRQVLAEADLIYAEDTRRSRKLLTALGVTAALRSYHIGNEAARAAELQRHLEEGKTIALVTDAGMPAVADPGLSAVHAAVAAGATVTVVPGPSAVTAAVAVSGLPSDRFVFEGFLPRKQHALGERIAEIAAEPRTVVLFLAPSRAVEELGLLAQACGADRPAVVARELTKLHEEVWRGTLGGAVSRFSEHPPRGEITAVIAGRPPPSGDVDGAVAEVVRLVGQEMSFRDAVRRAAARYGVGRRALYEAARSAVDDGP